MFSVAHVLIDTFAISIVPQVCIEEIDMSDLAQVFMHTFAKLILPQVCIE